MLPRSSYLPHPATETWERVLVPSLSPQPRSQLFSFASAADPASDTAETAAPTSPEPVTATPSLARQQPWARAVVRRLRGEAESLLESRHGLATQQRYSFLPPESCTEDR